MTDIITPLGIILFAALLHASFQLGTSLLTLLSGHSLSVKRSQFRVFRLTTSFVFGAGVMTTLLLSFITLSLTSTLTRLESAFAWSIIAGLLIGIGVAVWVTYYRKGAGTSLWVPREMADFLAHRTSKTRRSAESFSLGMTGVIGEVIFLVAPLSAAAYALLMLPPLWQFLGIIFYVILSLLPLLIVWTLVGYGIRISRIQSWRERNKHFLRHTASIGLVVLAIFIYVTQVVEVLV